MKKEAGKLEKSEENTDAEEAKKTLSVEERRLRKQEAQEEEGKPYLLVKRPETLPVLLPAPRLGVLEDGASSGPSSSSCAALGRPRYPVGKDCRGQGAKGARSCKGNIDI